MPFRGHVPQWFDHWPVASAWTPRPRGPGRAEMPPRPDEAPKPPPFEVPAPPSEVPGLPVELPPPPFEAPSAPKPEARTGILPATG